MRQGIKYEENNAAWWVKVLVAHNQKMEIYTF